MLSKYVFFAQWTMHSHCYAWTTTSSYYKSTTFSTNKNFSLFAWCSIEVLTPPLLSLSRKNVTCRLILTLLLTTTSTISFLMNSSIHLGHVYILIKMCKINKYSLFSDGFLSSWPYSILISWSHWKLSFLPQGKPCKDSRFWVSQDQCILLM